MAPIDKDTLTKLLTNGQHRSLIGGKQLTLAFGGVYIASTTLTAKPLLIWETETGYPRYYVPIESLHGAIRAQLSKSVANGQSDNQSKPEIRLEVIDSAEGRDTDSKAVIERLTVDAKSTNWVRFTEGPLMGFVRFEKDEIGKQISNRSSCDAFNPSIVLGIQVTQMAKFLVNGFVDC